MDTTLALALHHLYQRAPAVATAGATLAGGGLALTGAHPVVHGGLWVLMGGLTLLALRLDRRLRWFLWILILLAVLVFLRWTRYDRAYRYNCIRTTFYPTLTDPVTDPVRIQGILDRFPRRFPDAWELQVRTTSIEWRRRRLHCTGRIRVLIPDATDTRLADRYAQPAPARTVRPAWAPGAHVEILGYWQPILTFRNPGTDDRPRVYRVRGIHGRLRVRHPRLVQVVTPAPNRPAAWLHRYRTWIRAHIDDLAGGAESGTSARALLLALWLGDRYELPNDLYQAMARAGLLHLLALSGLHIGLLAGLVWVLVYSGLHLPRVLAYGLLCATVLFYILAVGHPPSVVRAGALVVLYAVARVLFLPVQPLNLLGAIFTVLVLWHPLYLLDLGFQLTFFIAAGLLYFLPHLLPAPRPSLGFRIHAYLLLSVIAWTVALPWSVGRFGYLSLGAPLFNLLTWPFVALLIGAGLVFPLLVPLPVLHPHLASLIQALDRVLQVLTHALLQIPTGTPTVTGTPSLLIPMAGIAVLAVVLPRLRALRSRMALLGLTLLLTLALILRMPAPNGFRGPGLVLLDVAQGESLVLLDRDRAVLLDGGGISGTRWDIGRWVVIPALQRLGVRAVEAVIMSHPHPDHYSGLRSVVEVYRPRLLFLPEGVWVPRYFRDSPAFAMLQARTLAEGDRWQWRSWRIQVLNPPPDFEQTPRTLNDGSLVLMARTGGWKILLTGDIEVHTEARLARAYGPQLASDILKLAHHGSRTSTTAVFFQFVRPRWALYAAGRRNRYGVPHTEVLQRLHASHVRVLGTQHAGQVRLYLEKRGILEVWTYHHPVRRVWPAFSTVQAAPERDAGAAAESGGEPSEDSGSSSTRVSG